MLRPVPKDVSEIAISFERPDMNWGLLFHKYFPVNDPQKNERNERNERNAYKYDSQWLKQLANHVKLPAGYAEILQCRLPDCFRFTGTTTKRLICGIGNSSVTDVGFNFHRLLGMPIIPGSSLKGLARHYFCERYTNASKPLKKLVYFLFGNEHDEPKNYNQGGIIYHDAWLDDKSCNFIYLDIMNPHYQEYYSFTPTQWTTQRPNPVRKKPIPIYFLTICPHTTFHFWLNYSQTLLNQKSLWLNSTSALDNWKEIEQDITTLGWKLPITLAPANIEQIALDLTWHILQQALQHWGIGAKTGSDYGDIQLDPQSCP